MIKRFLKIQIAFLLVLFAVIIVACKSKSTQEPVKPVPLNNLVAEKQVVTLNFSESMLFNLNGEIVDSFEDVNFKYKNLETDYVKAFFNIKNSNNAKINCLNYLKINYLVDGEWQSVSLANLKDEDICVQAAEINGKFYLVNFVDNKWVLSSSNIVVKESCITKVKYTQVEEFLVGKSLYFKLLLSLDESDFKNYNISNFDSMFELDIKINKLSYQVKQNYSFKELTYNLNLGEEDETQTLRMAQELEGVLPTKGICKISGVPNKSSGYGVIVGSFCAETVLQNPNLCWVNSEEYLGLKYKYPYEVKALAIDLPMKNSDKLEIEWQYYPDDELGEYSLKSHFNFSSYNLTKMFVCEVSRLERVEQTLIKQYGVEVTENIIPSAERNKPGKYVVMFETINSNIKFEDSSAYVIFEFELKKKNQVVSVDTMHKPHIKENNFNLSLLKLNEQVVLGPTSSEFSYEIINEITLNNEKYTTNIMCEISNKQLILKEDLPNKSNIKKVCLKAIRQGDEFFKDAELYLVLFVFEHDLENGFCVECNLQIEEVCGHVEVNECGICEFCSKFTGEEIPIIESGIFKTLNIGTYYYKIINMEEREYMFYFEGVNCKFFNSDLEDFTIEIGEDGKYFNMSSYVIVVIDVLENGNEVEVVIS